MLAWEPLAEPSERHQGGQEDSHGVRLRLLQKLLETAHEAEMGKQAMGKQEMGKEVSHEYPVARVGPLYFAGHLLVGHRVFWA